MEEVLDGVMPRHHELTTFADALESLRQGTGGVILIEGEAGIGKSWLLGRACASAAEQGWAVMVAGGDRFDHAVPYASLRRAVGRPVTGLDALGEQSRASMADVLDLGSGRPVTEVRSATLEFMAHARRERPVLMALDDLHLVDSDTVALLGTAIRQRADHPLVLVGALRHGTQRATNELTTLLNALDSKRVSTIALGPLPPRAVAEIVELETGIAPSAEMLDMIVSQSGGNPFLVQQALVAIGRSTASPLRLGYAQRASLQQRLLWMGDTAAAVARSCALLRRLRLDRLPLIAEMSGLDLAESSAGFDELVAHGVLVFDDGEFTFAHALLRETLLQDVGPAERRHAARRVSEWIAALTRPLDVAEMVERAMYAMEYAERGDEAAAAVLTSAAEFTAISAPLAAIDWYRRAIWILDPQSQEAALGRARLGRIHVIAGQSAEAVNEGRAALAELVSGPMRVRTADYTALALTSLGEVDQAAELLDDEIQRAPDAIRLHANRAHLMARLGRVDDAEVEEAITRDLLLTAGRSDAAIAHVHFAHTLVVTGRWDELDELWERQLALVSGLTSEMQLSAYANLAFHATLAGSDPRAAELVAAAQELADRIAPNVIVPELALAEAWHGLQTGEWDRLLESCERTRTSVDETQAQSWLTAVRAVEIEVHARRGSWSAARRLTGVASHPFARHHYAWALIGLELATGNLDAASSLAAEALQSGPVPAGVHEMLLARLAEVHVARGDKTAATAAARALAALTPHGRSANTEVLRMRGVVESDPSLLRSALAAAEGVRLPFALARVHLDLGELGVEDADQHLTTAHQGFGALDAVPWRRRAAVALRARGVKVPRRRAPRSGELTELEGQIAALVKDGRRNREIAGSLFVSVKTVEQYLTKIYAKLGVSSRLELARYMDSSDVAV